MKLENETTGDVLRVWRVCSRRARRHLVLGLHTDGMTFAEIGGMFGFSRQRAQQIMRGEQEEAAR